MLLLMVLGPAASPELPPRPSDASVASDPLAEREVAAQDEALHHRRFVARALHIEAAELAETGLSETPLP
ncbi:hypothetical protein PPSIR1_27343 [Plesiocystis pacifica SIR-1]|uniref:Uncharacterized protein n=1 Tax=Plesiocystis pacifica SIR-1 TaxID=391625 RepID=A6G4N3_9BACT|nr:hypothetical protein PPSIR1_27343 [Plesiocystis pacifica SIR-1]